MSGTVNIHGKEYKTVALRVSEFRHTHGLELGIETEIVQSDDSLVVMKATIKDKESRVIGTGFAEEKRGATQINKTSALENCETSAIGRALAACGFGGTEYASANEVQNAIQQQVSTEPVDHAKVAKASLFFKEMIDEDNEENHDRVKRAWDKLSSDERIAVQDLLTDKSPGCNKMYKTLLKEYLGL